MDQSSDGDQRTNFPVVTAAIGVIGVKRSKPACALSCPVSVCSSVCVGESGQCH